MYYTFTKSVSGIFLLIILSVTTSNSQLRYQNRFGGAILDWSNCIIQANDSSYLILGSTKNFGSGLQDMMLVRTNMNGDTLWTRSYGLAAGDEEAATIEQTSDGGFIFCGTTGSTGAGADDYILIKTDFNGNIQWSKTYGGPGVEFCSGVIQMNDGGYALCGNTNSFGAGGADIYIVRTNSTGDTLWTRTFGFSGTDNGTGIIETADSCIAVTGFMSQSGNAEAALLKIDANGNLLWSKLYCASGEDMSFTVAGTTGNGFCLGGSTTSSGTGGMDALLIRTDQAGAITWTDTYGTSDSDLVYNLKPVSSGGFVMTGNANRQGSIRDDLFLFKVDDNGTLQWANVMGGTNAARDVGRSVFETNEGSFIVSGFTQSFGGGTEAYFIKTDLLGSVGCNMINATVTSNTATFTDSVVSPIIKTGGIINSPSVITSGAPVTYVTLCSTISIEENSQSINLTVAPNPVSKNEILTIYNTSKGDKVILTTIDGKEVYSGIAGMDRMELNLATLELNNGIYMLHYISDNKKGICRIVIY